jgi:hypothetical protein
MDNTDADDEVSLMEGNASLQGQLYIITYAYLVTRPGFGLVIGFVGLLKLVTAFNYNTVANLTLYNPLQHAQHALSSPFITLYWLQCRRFLGFHVLWLLCSPAAISHCSSWFQPLAIVCHIAMSVHHWLVLTVCRHTI